MITKRMSAPLLIWSLCFGASEAATLDGQLQARSEKQLYQIELIPPAEGVEIGAIQHWQLHIFDSKDQPIQADKVLFDGGMPAHGHGLPTTPVVTATNLPGDYIVEGLQFSMPGEWKMWVGIEKDGQRDKAGLTFRIEN